jgi:hypothetical protein
VTLPVRHTSWSAWVGLEDEKMRWMLWLKTRHRTRLAVQQQRFDRDSNAD